MAEVISTAASDKVISTVTAEHLLHSTTTTHTILANEQHGLTKTITSMVHTDAESIQQAILTNLPHFMDQSKPNSNTTNADDTPINTVTEPTATENTATFAFVSLLTVDKTATGKPVKKLFSFDLQVDVVSSNELGTELVFATIPGSPDDVSVFPAIVEGTIILNHKSPDTTLVTLTASIVVEPLPGTETGSSGASFVRGVRKTMRPGARITGTGMNSMRGSSTSSALPPATGAAILDHFTNAVLSLHSQYARYEQVDAAMYMQFEEDTVPNAPPIEPHENDLVNRSLVFGDDSTTSAKFKRIKVSEREAPF